MSVGVGIIIVLLAAMAYVATPICLFLGWVRWVRQPKTRAVTAALSFLAFALATSSALLAIGMTWYAQVHPFRYYDPTLMKIYRLGFELSGGGLLFGLSGIWRSSPLRWYALICAGGTFAFWMLAAAGE